MVGEEHSPWPAWWREEFPKGPDWRELPAELTRERMPEAFHAIMRCKARHYGMQALYQWHMADANLNTIEAEFRGDYDFSNVDLDYFQALLHEAVDCRLRTAFPVGAHLSGGLDSSIISFLSMS